ncbi:uncharacterized protein M6D78_007493 [Vipera latastei]
MAAKPPPKTLWSAGTSPVQQSSLQALHPPDVLTLKDLQDALEKHTQVILESMSDKFAQMEEKLKKLEERMEERMEQKFSVMKVDILSSVYKVAECVEELDEKVEDLNQKSAILEAKVLENEDLRDKMDRELSLAQYFQMQFAIRIRGLKENIKEDLKQLVSEALEVVLNQPASEIKGGMDKVFRVNSWIARQRKLPRDVVVYFAKREIRDEVIQAAYDTKVVIADQEVLVLKEIPPKILRRRKDFTFLVQELKQRDIRFRWEIPAGLMVMHEGKRYRLVTVMQARDFYNNVLKATPLTLLEAAKGSGEGEHQVAEDGQAEEKGAGGDQVITPLDDPREQRVTRAALKRSKKIKEQDQQKSMELSQRTYSQVVGGGKRFG